MAGSRRRIGIDGTFADFRADDHSSGKPTRFVCNPSMAAFFKYVAGLSYFILEDARAGLYQWRTCRASHSITREEAPGRVPVGRAGVPIVDGGNEILGSGGRIGRTPETVRASPWARGTGQHAGFTMSVKDAPPIGTRKNA